MKTAEIRDKTVDEIEKDVSDLKEELFNLRFQSETNQLESTHRMKLVRKNVARCKTVLREKELKLRDAGE